MFKVFYADKDSYITNKVIRNNVSSSMNSNVGVAGSLDLFKLYGVTFSGSLPNLELSRILLHFDIQELKNLFVSGNIDIRHKSFFAKIKLSDVYGGQPTPDKFTINVCPLSKSFDEGRGRDIATFGDRDVCNFLTASFPVSKWNIAGCNKSGSIEESCDFYTGSMSTGPLLSSQYFTTGEEDLYVDVTNALSCTLTNQIPDAGFRISLSQQEEQNQKTYFVKRFASRHAYNEAKRPKLEVGFDDSIRDSTQNLTINNSGSIFLYNYVNGTLNNLLSGSTTITGSNSLILKLQLPISGGFHELIFTGSQHVIGNRYVDDNKNIFVTGVYSASFGIPSQNQHVSNALLVSGNIVKFTPIWGSLDGKLSYLTGSQITVISPTLGSTYQTTKKYVVTIANMNDSYRSNEKVSLRMNVFDHSSPLIKFARTPIDSPGSLQGVVYDAYYSVRNAITQNVVIPFDISKGSTRISSDAIGLFFDIDMANLPKEQSYVIDVMLFCGGQKQLYKEVSPIFKVSDSTQ